MKISTAILLLFIVGKLDILIIFLRLFLIFTTKMIKLLKNYCLWRY